MRTVTQLTRAMPVERLINNGLDISDALGLNEAIQGGEDWPAYLEGVWRDRTESAVAAERRGDLITARDLHLQASSAARWAQAALVGLTDERRSLYAKLVTSFHHAARCGPSRWRTIEHRLEDGETWYSWLLASPVASPAPTVAFLGGVDGWREKFETAGRQYLSRGLNVALVEVPGQGEARVLSDLSMSPERPFDGLATALRDIREDVASNGRLAVFALSFGAYLVRGAVGLHEGLVDAFAYCGGSLDPGSYLLKFPGRAAAFGELLALGSDACQDWLRACTARLAPPVASLPILGIHGGADLLYDTTAGQRFFESFDCNPASRFSVLKGDDHGINRNAHLRDMTCADWLAHVLNRP